MFLTCVAVGFFVVVNSESCITIFFLMCILKHNSKKAQQSKKKKVKTLTDLNFFLWLYCFKTKSKEKVIMSQNRYFIDLHVHC